MVLSFGLPRWGTIEQKKQGVKRKSAPEINISMTPNFDETLKQVLESVKPEILEEGKYCKWVDQKGREVYPKLLTMNQMKRVLKKKHGFFQKNGKIYSLPLIPTKGKIQKVFRKYYTPTFLTRPKFTS